MAFWLPFGFNRADGETPLPPQPTGSSGGTNIVGTPTPAGDLVIFSNSGNVPTVEEEVDSPEIERAEQATFQHRFKMSWAAALSYIVVLGRGTFVTDSFGNTWRVLSSKIQSMRGGMASLSVVAESISFDSPPDDYQMIPVELGIDIIKHPRYFFALYPSGNDFTDVVGTAPNTATRAQVKQAVIRAIQTYRDSPYFPQAGQVTMNGILQNTIINYFIQSIIPTSATSASEISIDVSGDPGCLLAIAAGSEIIQKLWNQEDTPYLTGFQITWSQYYFAPVYMNPGGYLEDPFGIVPNYFLSPSQDGSNTIFDLIANTNPQCYSVTGFPDGGVDISWLRKADEVEYQRTWFKVTRTWIGSPIGHWDPQLYLGGPSTHRPNVVGDYLSIAKKP